MRKIENERLDEERALYGLKGVEVTNCQFDGPKDGESALKECDDVIVKNSYFNLRYPFWHDNGLLLTSSTLTPNCRAALWYSNEMKIEDCQLMGIKAIRECSNVHIDHCLIDSPEFGWSTRGITMKNTSITSEYVMMRSTDLHFQNVQQKGKYSFQYIENGIFENCTFDTKDAFWHGKNVTLKNCVIKGEYLAWYSDGLTFDHCKIIGTQPLCYCRNLKLIDCEMIETDLAFEKSEVQASVLNSMISIKNPKAGLIQLPGAQELIFDDPEAKGRVEFIPIPKDQPVCSCTL